MNKSLDRMSKHERKLKSQLRKKHFHQKYKSKIKRKLISLSQTPIPNYDKEDEPSSGAFLTEAIYNENLVEPSRKTKKLRFFEEPRLSINSMQNNYEAKPSEHFSFRLKNRDKSLRK